jgi:hypothetical protein
MAILIDTPSRIRPIATVRYRAAIAMVNIEAVIYMAAKISMAVKPRARADEHTTGKPLRAVVAVGSTGVRSEVIVTVRTSGFGSDIDVDLSLYFRSGRHDKNTSDSSSKSTIESVHEFSSRSSGAVE